MLTLRRRQRLIAVMLVSTAVTTGCSSNKSQKPKPTPQVGFIIATPGAVPVPVTLGGRTVAYETSEVRPQVNGVILRRLFVEGGSVRAGQPLYQIDPSIYRAAANQASANLEGARASAGAAIALANRYRPLAQMQAIAAQDYTNAVAQARVARATISENAAALATARTNLRFTTVPAPISGRIGRSLITVGGLASTAQADPLAVIQRTDPIYVDMQQSAADLLSLRHQVSTGGIEPGSTTVKLTFEDGSAYAMTGVVKFSEVTVNQSTGTVTLRAQFPNPRGALLPGMFVTTTFEQAVDPDAFLVPQPAIQRDFDGSAYVMLVGAGNKAMRRKVTADRSYGANFVVTQGLRRGDRVILQGLNNLKQGAAIRPVPANSPQIPKPPKQGDKRSGGSRPGGGGGGQGG